MLETITELFRLFARERKKDETQQTINQMPDNRICAVMTVCDAANIELPMCIEQRK